MLLRKAFEYGTLVWLLRASGLRYWIAGVWVSAGLLLLEMAQRYLPNRQPEVTDACIAAILTCILWGSERRASVDRPIVARQRPCATIEEEERLCV